MTTQEVINLYDALYPVLGGFYVGLLAIRIIWRMS